MRQAGQVAGAGTTTDVAGRDGREPWRTIGYEAFQTQDYAFQIQVWYTTDTPSAECRNRLSALAKIKFRCYGAEIFEDFCQEHIKTLYSKVQK